MLDTVPASTRTTSFTSLTPESRISSSRTPAFFGSCSAGTSLYASVTLMPGASCARPRGGAIVGPQKSVVAAGALLHPTSASTTRTRDCMLAVYPEAWDEAGALRRSARGLQAGVWPGRGCPRHAVLGKSPEHVRRGWRHDRRRLRRLPRCPRSPAARRRRRHRRRRVRSASRRPARSDRVLRWLLATDARLTVDELRQPRH